MNSSSHCPCRFTLVLAALAGVAVGCASPLSTNYLAGSRRQAAEKKDSTDGVQQASAEEPAATGGAALEEPQTSEEALVQVLDDLQEIEAIDRGAKDKLMAELKDAKPSEYPLIVEAFRTALAYREQLARKETQQAYKRGRGSFREKTPVPFYENSTDATAMANATDRNDTRLSSSPYQGSDADGAHYRPDASTGEQAGPRRATALPPPPEAAHRVSDGAADVQRAGYERFDPAAGDWRAELEDAIAALEKAAAPQPRSVEELHDHMRLRMLQLVAGRDEAAYRPIPGATPNQQDYMSQQLFALATFLDAAGQPDEKQRAAAALLHLDEARARLAQLATLRVGSVTFVNGVDGFGAYEAVSEAKFRPGDPVTLYAEVENFRSESTPEGYRTSLSTSYEIVDSTGRRVAGAQFPEVEDVCRSHRRDFHMQYGIELPSRIYPDAYELRLIITDQLSNKIGQASVSFDIVD